MKPPELGIPTATRSAIRKKLLTWYDEHRRDLPWRRRASNPFAQWVAEVMLQQTQVGTVRRYYDRFLKRFPSHEALAAADLDEVLTYWQGLGYYRRILFLHRAARQLADSARPMPRSAAELRTLPGIGAYTSAAIASIAFNEPVAAVDGNVVRVLSRVLRFKNSKSDSVELKRIQSAAQTLLEPKRPGDFNQAWMDLGSMICRPRVPACSICPLCKHCDYFAETKGGDHRPARLTKKAKVKQSAMLVALVQDGCRILLRRRPLGGLWSGLWELPTEWVPTSDSRENIRRLRALASSEGVRILDRPEWLGTVRHRLTHLDLELHVYRCGGVQKANSAVKSECRWLARHQLAKVSISTGHRRVLDFIAEQPDRGTAKRQVR